MLLGSIGSAWNVVFYLALFPLIKLRVSDELIAVVGTFTWIVHCMLYFLARTSWLIYASRFINVGDWASCIAIQSVLLAFLEPDENSTLFALWDLISRIVHLPAAFAYSWLFRVTASISPSFVFLVPSVMTMLPLCLFLYLYIGARRSSDERVVEKSED